MNRKGRPSGRELSKRVNSPTGSSVSAKYVAGFVDAEGSLMVNRTRSAGRTPGYQPRIALANTNRGVLNAIEQRYGGILADQPAIKPTWKHAYQLVWTGGMIGPLLATIGVYLKVKSRQARVLQTYIRHQKLCRKGRSLVEFRSLLAREVAFKEHLRKQIRKLNRKGALEPHRVRPATRS